MENFPPISFFFYLSTILQLFFLYNSKQFKKFILNLKISEKKNCAINIFRNYFSKQIPVPFSNTAINISYG